MGGSCQVPQARQSGGPYRLSLVCRAVAEAAGDHQLACDHVVEPHNLVESGLGIESARMGGASLGLGSP